MFLGTRAHPFDNAWISQHARILDLDRRAFAQRDGHVLAPGGVAGQGDIHGQANLRVDPIGRRTGAARADFLLGGEDKIQLMRRGFQGTQGLDQYHTADAVVHGLGHQAPPQVKAGPLESRHIADLHRAVRGVGRADIHETFLHGR